MEKATFPAEVISRNRITIPHNFIVAMGLNKGDTVTVTIQKKEGGQ